MTIEVPYITILQYPRCGTAGCVQIATHRVHFDKAQGGFDAGFIGEYCLKHANDLLVSRSSNVKESLLCL